MSMFRSVVMMLALVAVAHAEPAQPPADAVPAGTGWTCATTNLGNRCWRAASECKPEGKAKCSKRDTAWVTTFHLVTEYAWRYFAFASEAECKAAIDLLKPEARATATSCKSVGKSTPAPAPFRAEGVEPGEHWYCPRSTTNPHCDREADDCAMHDDDCKAQDKAFAYSTLEDVTAYATLAICEKERKATAATVTGLGVSACTAVGAKARPVFEPSAVPAGDHWYCFGGGFDMGGVDCSRTLDQCNAYRSRFGSDDSGACAAVGSVFAFQDDGATYPFVSAATCKQLRHRNATACVELH